MVENFIFSFLATLGCSVLFGVPKKMIPLASLGGAIGWMGFIGFGAVNYNSPVTAAFVGATLVAIWGEILSHKLKDIITVFIIPGIMPMVPGSGMYFTMLAIIEKDFQHAAVVGSETLFVAGSIASALILVSSVSRLIRGRRVME